MKKSLLVFLFLAIAKFTFGQTNEQRGNEFYALGNYTRAIEVYQSLEDKNTVYDKIAKAYAAIGNYGEALSYYERAIETNSDNTLLKYDYAKLLTKTKKYDNAKGLFKDLILTDSLNPNFHYELGIVLEKQKDTLAVNAFLKTFELDNTHQKAIFKIAKQHIKKRKFKEAHNFIDKGLESYTNNIELISLKAQAYYFQEYYTHAVVWFNKLLDLGEKSEFIHEKLSLSFAQNSDYEDAIFHRKEALKYNPYNANAMFVIGGYYERLSDFKQAEEYYKKSLMIQDVSLSNEYQKLGRVLNRQKKYKEAIKAFQKSLKEDPSNVSSEFFILVTKEEFYEDIDAKIKAYEDFLKNKSKSPFKMYAEERLSKLKEEKFMEQD